jgi:hypothetical protein
MNTLTYSCLIFSDGSDGGQPSIFGAASMSSAPCWVDAGNQDRILLVVHDTETRLRSSCRCRWFLASLRGNHRPLLRAVQVALFITCGPCDVLAASSVVARRFSSSADPHTSVLDMGRLDDPPAIKGFTCSRRLDSVRP